jgi:HEAT repeat protein
VVYQAEIHRMARSEDVEERKRAVEELKNNFALLEDKKYAWEDLIKLTSDTDSDVRRGAAHALVRSFSQTHNKKYVWEDLHRLTSDNDSYVRRGGCISAGKHVFACAR